MGHQWVDDALDDEGVGRGAGTAYAFSPRFMSRFQIGGQWEVFAAYGRGFRSPEARAYTRSIMLPPDVDLDTYQGGEASMTLTDNTEVGTRFRLGELFDVTLAGFGIWIGRERIFDHASGSNIELSGTTRLGLEAAAHVHPTPWLDIGADFTAVHARFRGSGEPIPGAPPFVTSLFASFAHPTGWRAGLRWFLLSPRPLSFGAKAGVSTVLDFNVGYRYRWVQVDLSLDNALGLKWREGEYNFASHWTEGQPRSQIPTLHYIAGYPLSARATLSFFL